MTIQFQATEVAAEWVEITTPYPHGESGDAAGVSLRYGPTEIVPRAGHDQRRGDRRVEDNGLAQRRTTTCNSISWIPSGKIVDFRNTAIKGDWPERLHEGDGRGFVVLWRWQPALAGFSNFTTARFCARTDFPAMAVGRGRARRAASAWAASNFATGAFWNGIQLPADRRP